MTIIIIHAIIPHISSEDITSWLQVSKYVYNMIQKHYRQLFLSKNGLPPDQFEPVSYVTFNQWNMFFQSSQQMQHKFMCGICDKHMSLFKFMIANRSLKPISIYISEVSCMAYINATFLRGKDDPCNMNIVSSIFTNGLSDVRLTIDRNNIPLILGSISDIKYGFLLSIPGALEKIKIMSEEHTGHIIGVLPSSIRRMCLISDIAARNCLNHLLSYEIHHEYIPEVLDAIDTQISV